MGVLEAYPKTKGEETAFSLRFERLRLDGLRSRLCARSLTPSSFVPTTTNDPNGLGVASLPLNRVARSVRSKGFLVSLLEEAVVVGFVLEDLGGIEDVEPASPSPSSLGSQGQGHR
jgi:hypothetical protein